MYRNALAKSELGPPGGHHDGPLAGVSAWCGPSIRMKRLSIRINFFAIDKEQNISKNFIVN